MPRTSENKENKEKQGKRKGVTVSSKSNSSNGKAKDIKVTKNKKTVQNKSITSNSRSSSKNTEKSTTPKKKINNNSNLNYYRRISNDRSMRLFREQFLYKLSYRFYVSAFIVILAITVIFSHKYNYSITELAQNSISGFANDYGFSVRQVTINGRNHLAIDKLKTALNIEYGDNILLESAHDIQSRINEIDWVKSASVRIVLPERVIINLEERIPIALYKNNDNLFLVDGEGVLIQTDNFSDFIDLPIISGDNAHLYIADLLDILQSQPEMFSKVSSINMVRRNRWNINFFNGMEVLLPEKQTLQAWQQLADLQEKQKIMNRAVSHIDMRIPGRVVFRVIDSDEDKSHLENNT